MLIEGKDLSCNKAGNLQTSSEKSPTYFLTQQTMNYMEIYILHKTFSGHALVRVRVPLRSTPALHRPVESPQKMC